ncbi:YtxH domain-containing protein [Myxococcus sp. Y35]|uniref:YtxH domain-containing protein n=1 Tax=Pseudomyxococcus flavus TaxID=3115648 RepID=UPI003CE90D99
MTKTMLMAAALGVLVMGTGCSRNTRASAENDAERAAEKTEDAANEAGDKIEDTAEEAGDNIEDATDN